MGYAVFHEMDYDDRHLERGEYLENFIPGMSKNDNALLTVGYIKEHDGKNLNPCLRCGKQFVSSLDAGLFLRMHEQTCPMETVEIPQPEPTSEPESEETKEKAELSPTAQVLAGMKQGE